MEFGDSLKMAGLKSDHIETLAEPRKRNKGAEMELMPGLPPNPLPTWTSLPLDHKLPMIPGPKGSVRLFTTGLGERIHKRPSGLDFDLTDPYSMLMSNYYKPLHDPHLKPHLYAPHIRNRLIQHGFITKDGKVLCTLKEFNDYRQYVRKVNLLLAKKRQDEERDQGAQKAPKKESEAGAVQRKRAQRVREIRHRLSKQYERDRARYIELKAEEDERRRRIREQRLSKSSDKERAIREGEERRHTIMMHRQMEERRRKQEKLRHWLEEDKEKQARAEARRKQEEQQHQKKLEQNWELRKSVQEKMLNQSSMRSRRVEDERNRRIEDRNKRVQLQRNKQQAIFVQIIEKRRKEREEDELRYYEKLNKKLERKRRSLERKRRRGRKTPHLRSEERTSLWDLEESLAHDFPPASHKDKEFTKTGEETEGDVAKLTHLSLAEFHGASLSADFLRVAQPTSVHVSIERAKSEKIESRRDGRLIAPESLMPFSPSGLSARSSGRYASSSEGLMPQNSAMDVYNALKSNRHKERRPTPQINVGEVKYVKGQVTKLAKPMLCLEEDSESTLFEQEYWDEYELSTEEEDEDRLLDDIQKSAKGVVQMSLFLTTQVVYPAYLRWLESDHPQVYAAYVQEPHKSLSQIAQELHGEARKEKADKVEARPRKPKPKGVKFQQTTEVMPDSNLEYMSYMAHHIDFADDEESSWSGPEEDEDEPEPPVRERRLSLSYRDSVERLHLSSHDVIPITEEEEEGEGEEGEKEYAKEEGPSVKELGELLKMILNELSCGRLLKSEDIAEMTALAKHILANLKSMTVSAEASAETTAPTSPISQLADHVVGDTIDKVMCTLLYDGLPEQMDPKRTADFAQYIVNKAVTAAVEQLQEAAAAERSEALEEKASSTTDFVWGVIDRTAREAGIAVEKPKQKKLDTPDVGPAKSTTSALICSVIERTAKEIESDLRRVNAHKRASDTSLFVKYVVEEAAKDIQQKSSLSNIDDWGPYRPKPVDANTSSLSQFVQFTLYKVISEMEKEGTFEAVPTAQLTRNASSLFAENLVECALQQQLIEVKNDAINRHELAKMTASILVSQRSLTGDSTERRSQGIVGTQSLDQLGSRGQAPHNISSMLAEALIRETLSKTLADIKQGVMSTTDVDLLAKSIGKSGFAYCNKGQPSALSLSAEEFVTDTLNGVLRELGLRTDAINQDTALSAIEKGLKASISKDKVLSGKTISAQDVKSSQSVNVFIQGVLQRALESIESQKSQRSLRHAPTTKSSEELGELIYDVLNKAAASLAQLSGIKYSGMDLYVDRREPQLTSASSQDVSSYIKSIIETSKKQISDESLRKARSTSTVSVQYKGDLESFVRDVIEETTMELSEAVKASSGLKVTPVTADRSDMSNMHEHVVLGSDQSLHEESSEECIIEPVFCDKAVPVEHHAIEDALAIISVKKDKDLNHIHICEAVPRNSFRNLFHPNLERVRRLSLEAESQDDVCKRILTLSSRCIESLSHPDNDGEGDDEESLGSNPSVSDEEHAIQPDKLLSITQLHNPIDKPDENAFGELMMQLCQDDVGSDEVVTKNKTSVPKVKSISSKQSPYNSKMISDSPKTSKTRESQRSWSSITAPTSSSLLKMKPKAGSQTTSPTKSTHSVKATSSQSPSKRHVVSHPSLTRAKWSAQSGVGTKMSPRKASESSRATPKTSTSLNAQKRSSQRVVEQRKHPSSKSVHSRESMKRSTVSTTEKGVSPKSKKSSSKDTSVHRESVAKNVQDETIKDAQLSEKNNHNLKDEASQHDAPMISQTTGGRNDVIDTNNDAVGIPKAELVNTEKDAKKKEDTVNDAVYFDVDGVPSDLSLRSAPPEMERKTTEDTELVKKRSDEALEEILEEIERPVKFPSKRRSLNKEESSYDPTIEASQTSARKSSREITLEMQSSSHPVIPKKPPVPPKHPKSSRTSVGSRRSIRSGASLGAPRPSSGYRKSPTPQMVSTKVPSDPEKPDSTATETVTSRIMKSITSLGEMILGKKPSATSIHQDHTTGAEGSEQTSFRDQKSSITLSPKLSQSSLLHPGAGLDGSTRSSAREVKGAEASSRRASCVHSEYGDEEVREKLHDLHKEIHTQHHHGPHHRQHKKECPSSGSLPQLQTESHALVENTPAAQKVQEN